MKHPASVYLFLGIFSTFSLVLGLTVALTFSRERVSSARLCNQKSCLKDTNPEDMNVWFFVFVCCCFFKC